MNKKAWPLPITALIALVVLISCPGEVTIPHSDGTQITDPDTLETGRTEGSFFTKYPTLFLVTPNSPYGTLRVSYAQAEPKNNENTTYSLYIAEGNFVKINDIISAAMTPVAITASEYASQDLPLNQNQPYSAVLLAENGSSKAFSSVKQATTIGGFEWVTAEEETGVFKSEGSPNIGSENKNAKGGTTYFVDAQRGNDSNDGKHPTRAFRSFRVINNDKNLGPGDQVLLEANSIWNGIPVTKDNYHSQAALRGNGGMLAPKTLTYGGTADAPIIIDIYRVQQNSDGSLTGFFSANQRPIINGNGTPSMDAGKPYGQSAVIEVIKMEYVHVRNIEVTNSFDFPKIAEDITWRDIHWQKWRYQNPLVAGMDQRLKDGVPKVLWGFMAGDESADKIARGFLIENNYVHDVQSFNRNGRNVASDWVTNTYFGFPADNPGKRGGGFMLAYSDSVLKGNILRRLGYCGTHSFDDYYPNTRNKNLRYIGNYFEDIWGDALVAGTLTGNPAEWNIVESNIAVRPGARLTNDNANFAAIFTYYASYTLFQYNECYGMMYGYQDSQAWDIDDLADNNVFQYNYSHHNSGGALLVIMGTNGVFRYNISANDGIGVRGLEKIQAKDSVLGRDYRPIIKDSPCYTDFNPGSSIFLLYDRSNNPSSQHPLIYNNTIFTGPGHTVGLVGHSDTKDRNTYIRFYNNILLKAGEGKIILSYGESDNGGYSGGYIWNPDGFTNNLLWAYSDINHPDVPAMDGISNGTQGMSSLLGTQTGNSYAGKNGNKWMNPRLKIQESGMIDILRKQYDTEFFDRNDNNNNPERLAEFTGKERLRGRASLFMPVDQTAANALQFGKVIPAVQDPDIDNAWNDGFYTMDKGKPDTGVGSQLGSPSGFQIRDFFGDPITNPPAAGAAQKPFTDKEYNPDPLFDKYRYMTDPSGN